MSLRRAGLALLPLGLLASGCAPKGKPPAPENRPAIEFDLPADLPRTEAVPPVTTSAPKPHEPAPAGTAVPPLQHAPGTAGPGLPPDEILREFARDPERLYRRLQETPKPAASDENAAILRDLLEAYFLTALGDAAGAHGALAEAERALRAHCPLAVRNLCLTDAKPGGYGNPARLDPPKPSARDPLNVYFELDRVSQRKQADRYQTHIDVNLTLETEDGKPVDDFAALEKEFRLRDRQQESGRCHTDFYFHLTGLRPARALAAGKYKLVVECRDMVPAAPRTARETLAFEVTP